MNDYTHITMVIDRSGSMHNAWSDVVNGYKQIVQDNKKLDGKCTFTVAVFDDKYETLENFTDIKEVKDTLTVTPRGMTALLDAIGRTINLVGARLANMDEKDRPSKVIVMVTSDGQENSSKEFTKEAVQKLVSEQTEQYNWQFQFIGASLDSVNDAKSWGFQHNNVSTYNESNTGATYTIIGEKMKSIRNAQTHDCYIAAAQFTAEERAILNSSKS